ncbi:RNA-binding protein 42 [Homalodisca vitripennis]|nr:RNA-binding protein 42 [Homalodisca vitripennis]KAG8329077.1 RNA-binding protein 42 [Homalodisca vitripennis]
MLSTTEKYCLAIDTSGRYVGSRPIKLRKSSWRNRSLDVVRKKDKEKAALIGLLTGLYGQNAMSDSMVRRWIQQFNEGLSEVHDEEQSGHPSLVIEELVHAIDDKIQENRQFKISALAMEFP